MDNNFERDRFALIFNKIDGHLVLETVTEVIPIDTKNSQKGFEKINFIVKSGPYSGKTENDFNYLRGDQGRGLFLSSDSILISDIKTDVPSIYIFDNEFLDRIQENRHYTRVDLYCSLAKLAYDLELIEKDKNTHSPFISLEAVSFERGKSPFTRSKVDKLLSENVVDANGLIEELSRVFSSVIALPLPLFLVPSTDVDDEKVEIPNEIYEEDWLDDDTIDVVEIINKVSEKFVGQEEAVKTLVSNIYYNKVLIESLDSEHICDEAELDSRKVSILLDGTTGTGKTAIVKDIASKLDLPVVIASANSFSETGYVGPTITDLLKELLRKANGDKNAAERGIIVLDEIDKIATHEERNHSMKQGVQEELLSFIGGGKYELSLGMSGKIQFDTSKITFILMGAFTDIKDKKIKENESKKIGFDTNLASKEKVYTVTPQDYIDYGIMREFFGRIKVIASTKTYSKDDLKKILLGSTISPLKNFDKTVKLFGYSGIKYKDEFIDKVVDEAYNMNTGARGLQTVMSGIQDLLLLDLETGLNKLDSIIELDSSMVDKYKEKNIRKY